MNTPRSVAYGWGVLMLATGIGYYMAKGTNEERWKDQRARGLRSSERTDWKEKVAKAEAEEAAAAAATVDTGTAPDNKGAASQS